MLPATNITTYYLLWITTVRSRRGHVVGGEITRALHVVLRGDEWDWMPG